MSSIRVDVIELYVAFFARPAEPAGAHFWAQFMADELGAGRGLDAVEQEIATRFADTAEARALYGFLRDPANGDVSQFVNSVYRNLFNRNAGSEGLDFWQGRFQELLETGTAVEEVASRFVIEILNAAQGDDAAAVQNKVAVATSYSERFIESGAVFTPAEDLKPAVRLLADVGARDVDVVEAKTRIEELLAKNLTAGGVVIDGFVAGALVGADANDDGRLQASEILTTTDENGRFAFDEELGGRIVSRGGVDTTSGQEIFATLTAPEGSTVLSPLTTLVDRLQQRQGGSASEAATDVKAALDMQDGVTLSAFDPVAALTDNRSDNDASAVQVQAAVARVANTVVLAANAGMGVNGTTDANSAANIALAEITGLLDAADDPKAFDLTASEVITEIIRGTVSGVAQRSNREVSEATLDRVATNITEVAVSANRNVEDAVQNTDSRLGFQAIIQAQAVVRGAAGDSVRAGAASGDFATTLDTFTGADFDQEAAQAEIDLPTGIVEPTPPDDPDDGTDRNITSILTLGRDSIRGTPNKDLFDATLANSFGNAGAAGPDVDVISDDTSDDGDILKALLKVPPTAGNAVSGVEKITIDAGAAGVTDNLLFRGARSFDLTNVTTSQVQTLSALASQGVTITLDARLIDGGEGVPASLDARVRGGDSADDSLTVNVAEAERGLGVSVDVDAGANDFDQVTLNSQGTSENVISWRTAMNNNTSEVLTIGGSQALTLRDDGAADLGSLTGARLDASGHKGVLTLREPGASEGSDIDASAFTGVDQIRIGAAGAASLKGAQVITDLESGTELALLGGATAGSDDLTLSMRESEADGTLVLALDNQAANAGIDFDKLTITMVEDLTVRSNGRDANVVGRLVSDEPVDSVSITGDQDLKIAAELGSTGSVTPDRVDAGAFQGNLRINTGDVESEITGGSGDDWITDGAGGDTLTGNSGRDRFILTDFDAADTVTDFEAGTDRIHLDNDATDAANDFGAVVGDTNPLLLQTDQGSGTRFTANTGASLADNLLFGGADASLTAARGRFLERAIEYLEANATSTLTSAGSANVSFATAGRRTLTVQLQATGDGVGASERAGLQPFTLMALARTEGGDLVQFGLRNTDADGVITAAAISATTLTFKVTGAGPLGTGETGNANTLAALGTAFQAGDIFLV